MTETEDKKDNSLRPEEEEQQVAYLEKFNPVFVEKALVWQENEVRKIDCHYQRLNYDAIKDNRHKIRNKVAI